MIRPCLLLPIAFGVSATVHAQVSVPDDRFLAGYAAAVLEREFLLVSTGLLVVDGHLRYPDQGLGRLEREEIESTLRAIPGVKSVTPLAARPDGAPLPSGAATSTGASDGEPLTAYLAPGRLFDPLLADPRWPHFFASYHYYTEHGNGGGTKPLEHVGSVGFGETISIVRSSHADGFRWEVGLQAGVFAIFDLDSDSKDLVNADYSIGPYAAFRYRDLSVLTRLYHQSSHLGDEYILREGITSSDRVNLSYEAVDAVVSYELPYGFRLYGGGGYLLEVDPQDLARGSAQYGAEWRAPFTFACGLRPLFAADLQHREESEWAADYSLRLGVQFEEPGRFSQRMALLLEFYDGRSPNGQFYTDRIEYVGIGLHMWF